MRYFLDPEQRLGARFLAQRPVAMLADAPGVGKTAQIVRACDYLGARRIVGITTNRTLALNTAREFVKWGFTGWPVHILQSGKDDVPDDGVVLVSYALARNPRIRKLLRERTNDVVFLDEAHRVKDALAQQTIAILSQRGKDGGAGLARTARHVWFATGTPVPNHAGELFVFAACAGVFRGNFAAWVNQFCICDDEGKIRGSKNMDALRAMLAPVYLRREQRSIPEPRITDMLVEGKSDPYETLPADLRARLLDAIERGDFRFGDTDAISKVRRLVGLAKVPGVAELVEHELQSGYEKVLVFCHHTDVVRLLHEKLARHGSAVIEGRTPPKARDRIISEFAHPSQRVRVLQTQAACEGLDGLKVANRVILAEPEWTPILNEQAICRSARRGQVAAEVHASFIYLKNSLDEQVSKTIARKTQDILQII